LITDRATGWLIELFEYVVEAMSPDFQRVELVIAESFEQASIKMQEREKVPIKEAGITAIIRDFYKEKPESEYPQWKAGVDLAHDFFYIIMKPHRIRDQGSTYEDVTEGMAHEISEAIVIKDKQDQWTDFSQDQIDVLGSYEDKPLPVLQALQVFARERLADKLSAEHGFGREMFCSLDERRITTYISVLDARGLGSASEDLPGLTMETLGWDKSISLHAAGQSHLADSYLELWCARVRNRGEIYGRFMDHYREVRQRFLSMPFTANSFLIIRNSEFIESM
jgi:hypothetical protein